MKSRIELYLEEYAEDEARKLGASLFDGRWDHVVLVPCYGENQILDNAVESLDIAAGHVQSRALILVLINGANSGDAYGQQNLALLKRVQEHAPGLLPKSWWQKKTSADVLYIDRTCGASQENQGVGWARKQGCDLALKLIHAGKISAKWIHTTDADAQVDRDYFDFSSLTHEAGLGKKLGVVVHPFWHEGVQDSNSPIALYDRWLRYYEEGLRAAGSPFAFPTIGSLLSMEADTYAAVRGFPQKDAAEDFYFLSKAAKVSKIALGGGRVVLANRSSARVPFGTGVGVRKIEDRIREGRGFTLYHPETFTWLKKALDQAHGTLEQAVTTELDCPLPVKESLVRSGYFKALAEASRRKSLADRVRTFHSHWDAFQTLKFTHLLRDSFLPEVPYTHIVAKTHSAFQEREKKPEAN